MDRRRSIVSNILNCLASALAEAKQAAATRAVFERIAASEDPGPALVEQFAEAWSLDAEQARIFGEFPAPSLRLLCHAVVEACRQRESGVQMHVHVRGVVGAPRSAQVSINEDGGLDLLLVSNEFA